MDISDSCTTTFVELSPDATLSEVRGAFDTNDETRAIVVRDDVAFRGVITQRQLLASRHSPEKKARSVMRSPPRVSPTEDVRETARLMVENQFPLLPVFEGDNFTAVVTERNLLADVREELDALDVSDVYTADLVTAPEDATLGDVIHRIRTFGVSRLPIVDGDEAVGMVSVYDLVDFTVREMDREQGGSAEGFDGHGGSGSAANYNTHGGYGERAGFAARMLDLPASDVMTTPVSTVDPESGLGDAVERMLDEGLSSLLVVDDADDSPIGIVTTTDALRSLTWTEETHMPVRISGVGLMEGLGKTEVAERIEAIEGKFEAMSVIEASVTFQQHRERRRGTPLVRATVRLFTDRGTHVGTGEEYGAQPAFDGACDVLERNVLDEKDQRSPRKTDVDRRERSAHLVEWWLESDAH